MFVVDHELIEAESFLRREDADPVNIIRDLVDSRHRASSFRIRRDVCDMTTVQRTLAPARKIRPYCATRPAAPTRCSACQSRT